MHSSWNFIIKSDDILLKPLHEAMALMSKEVKERFSYKESAITDTKNLITSFLLALLKELFFEYNYKGKDIQTILQELSSGHISIINRDDTDITYEDFLKIICKSEEKIPTDNLENYTIYKLYSYYLQTLSQNELNHFSRTYKFINTEMPLLIEEVKLRLQGKNKFQENALDTLFKLIRNRYVHGESKILEIELKRKVYLGEQLINKLSTPSVRVGIDFEPETDPTYVPLIIIVAIIAIRRNSTHAFSSSIEAVDFIDNLLRDSKNPLELSYFILCSISKDVVTDEKLYSENETFLANLNFQNTEISNTTLYALRNYVGELVEYLYKRILSFRKVLTEEERSYIEDIGRRINPEEKTYCFINLIPYLPLSKDIFYAPKNDEKYKFIDKLFLHIKGFDYNQIIKEYSDDEKYDKIIGLNDVYISKSLENTHAKVIENSRALLNNEFFETQTQVTAYDVIRKIVEFSKNVDLNDDKTINELKSSSFNEYMTDYIKKHGTQEQDEFYYFLNKSFNSEDELNNKERYIKVLEERLLMINQLAHRVRHEISPNLGFLKGRLQREDSIDKNNISENKKVVEDIRYLCHRDIDGLGLFPISLFPITRNNDIINEIKQKADILYSKLNVSQESNSKYEFIRIIDETVSHVDRLVSFTDDDSSIKMIDKIVDINKIINNLLKRYSCDETFNMNVNFDTNVQLFVRANGEVENSVFNNIIQNAVRHGFAGRERKLNNIRIQQVVKDKTVDIYVSNNGYPFKGDLSRVFDYKVSFGETANTGEGLYIVRSYMNLIGGKVAFVSHNEEEYGVTIKVTFIKA